MKNEKIICILQVATIAILVVTLVLVLKNRTDETGEAFYYIEGKRLIDAKELSYNPETGATKIASLIDDNGVIKCVIDSLYAPYIFYSPSGGDCFICEKPKREVIIVKYHQSNGSVESRIYNSEGNRIDTIPEPMPLDILKVKYRKADGSVEYIDFDAKTGDRLELMPCREKTTSCTGQASSEQKYYKIVGNSWMLCEIDPVTQEIKERLVSLQENFTSLQMVNPFPSPALIDMRDFNISSGSITENGAIDHKPKKKLIKSSHNDFVKP